MNLEYLYYSFIVERTARFITSWLFPQASFIFLFYFFWMFWCYVPDSPCSICDFYRPYHCSLFFILFTFHSTVRNTSPGLLVLLRRWISSEWMSGLWYKKRKISSITITQICSRISLACVLACFLYCLLPWFLFPNLLVNIWNHGIQCRLNP